MWNLGKKLHSLNSLATPIISNTRVECMPCPNQCYTDLQGHLQIVEIVNNKLTNTKSQE